MKQLLVALGTAVLTVVVANIKEQKARESNVATPIPGASAPAPAPARVQTPPPSVVRATKVIDTYLQRHPTGRGTKALRRLSVAIKARPVETRGLAEVAARRVARGSISKKDEVMLEEAATLAERVGLSPQEMAEFMKKWERGIGLSGKPEVAGKLGEATRADLPRFDGKLHLVYRFEGKVDCRQVSCANIPVSLRISAGHWVETRDGMTDPQGHYALQVPVLTAAGDKVLWRLQSHTQDLRQAELSGEHVTTSSDRDITLQNNLIISGK